MSSSHAPHRKSLRDIAHDVMLQRGLEPDFSDAVLNELKQIDRAAVDPSTSVRDMRAPLWCSIDNDDSRDLDQLSVAEALANNQVRVLIAVADVDAVVKKASAIDAHASTNTTSVYTAGGTFPMLPEKLSTDLTSLNQDVERLAIVVDMTVAADGTVVSGDIYRATVVNKAKLAYNSVAAWLDGTAAAPAPLAAVKGLDDNLRLQDRIAKAMRSKRLAHGALTLETSEARAVYQGETLIDLSPDVQNRANDLIEDFMVAANGVAAKFLDGKGFPTVRRILKTPERWDRIVQLAAPLGGHLPATPDATALNAFLQQRQKADPERFQDLSLSVVKLLGPGEYALDLPGQAPVGHFALAVRDYSHSTAPNRRFPDMITQRLLKAALAGTSAPYTNTELGALAAHCTLQEDNAKKVERQLRKSAAALLLSSRIGQQFDGIVTGANDKGTWVRVTSPMAEGKVVEGFQGLDVGDKVRVKLVHTDVARGFIDFVKTS